MSLSKYRNIALYNYYIFENVDCGVFLSKSLVDEGDVFTSGPDGSC